MCRDILDVLLQADMMMIRVQARHVAGLMSMCTNNCGISKFALVILKMVCHASMYITMSSM